MGTPEIAAANLKNLLENGFDISAVFTPPDKPKGRGYKLIACPVKQLATENNIDVYQPKTLKNSEAIDLIKKINPDLIIVVAYGLILPKKILEIPKHGCINIHTSLLPKYRGAAPAQWSLINGEEQTGVTAMFMDEGLDTGDIITYDETAIESEETSEELLQRLTKLSFKTILRALEMVKNNNVTRIAQDNSQATWAPILDKSLSYISFDKTATEVHNIVRGINPWPVAKVSFNNQMLKIYKTRVVNQNFTKGTLPGTIIDDKKFVIACRENAIELLEIQLENGKRMCTHDFLLGHKIKVGDVVQSIK